MSEKKECKRIRLGLTWFGEPPKCLKHTKNFISNKYYFV